MKLNENDGTKLASTEKTPATVPSPKRPPRTNAPGTWGLPFPPKQTKSPPEKPNAVVESFWSRLQVELLNRKRWRTRVELANAIFEYLEIFYNRQRRHSALGMLTPAEFEAGHEPGTAA